MLKKRMKTIIITSLLILVPMLAGIILWGSLPDRMATHFNALGQADGWGSKGFTVFGIPVIFLAMHLVCVAVLAADPKNKDTNSKAITMVLWVFPIMSVVMYAIIFGKALEMAVDVPLIMMLFFGLFFAIIGNYLPKCRQNYTLGIKVPWTLNDPDNWNRTHRFAGRLWTVCGILMMLLSFTRSFPLFLGIAMVMVTVPVIYSYLYYRRHKNDSADE